MADERYVITLGKELAQKLRQKAKRKGFKDLKDYIYDILQHHAYFKGGRPKGTSFDTLAEKFAQHTKESKKRLRVLRRIEV